MSIGFNHVGIGVREVDTAIVFYRDVFSCRILRDTFEVTSDGPNGDQPADVLKSRPFRKMKMANLITPNGIGLELFQLIDPPHEPRVPVLEYWKSGTFHFCMTAPDIDATIDRILELGGKQISQIWQCDPEDPTRKMVYCTDPWGTVIELYTHTFGEMYG